LRRSPSPARSDAAAAAKPSPAPPGVTTGEIFVDSRPQGARVLIDGKLQGVTPLRLTNQPVASYEIRLELTDHLPWTSTARVPAGGIARVTGSLDRIR
jgi:PEGA domain